MKIQATEGLVLTLCLQTSFHSSRKLKSGALSSLIIQRFEFEKCSQCAEFLEYAAVDSGESYANEGNLCRSCLMTPVKLHQ